MFTIILDMLTLFSLCANTHACIGEMFSFILLLGNVILKLTKESFVVEKEGNGLMTSQCVFIKGKHPLSIRNGRMGEFGMGKKNQ